MDSSRNDVQREVIKYQNEDKKPIQKERTHRKTIRCVKCGHRFAIRIANIYKYEDSHWVCEFCGRRV